MISNRRKSKLRQSCLTFFFTNLPDVSSRGDAVFWFLVAFAARKSTISYPCWTFAKFLQAEKSSELSFVTQRVRRNDTAELRFFVIFFAKP